MKAIAYLFFHELKNRIISFFKRPANWIISALMVAALAVVIIGGGKAPGSGRSMDELLMGCSALFIVMFLLITFSGLKRGASLFSLSDVHTLFTAPVSPRRVLFYGLFKQLGTSLLVGLFLLFQYAWLRDLYGISVGFLLWVLVMYATAIFAGQLLAMTLYVLTSSNPEKRGLCNTVLYVLSGLLAAFALYHAIVAQPDWLGGLTLAGQSPLVAAFPVGGWLGGLLRAIWAGNWGGIALFAGLYLAFLGLLTWVIARTNTDYYEDVLGATEYAHLTRQAQKEGRMNDIGAENAKVGKVTLGTGTGAEALYQKIKLESRRARRFLLEPMQLIFLICSLAYSYFMRNMGIIPILFFTTYMQLFSVGNARWTRELKKPYVYLIPASPYRKLLTLLRTDLVPELLESVVQYGLIGLVFLKVSPVETMLLILARFTMGLLVAGGNVMVERVFVGVKSKGVGMLIYIVAQLVLMVPSIAVAVLGSIYPLASLTALATAMLYMSVLNTLVGLLVLYCCRNLLANAEVA